MNNQPKPPAEYLSNGGANESSSCKRVRLVYLPAASANQRKGLQYSPQSLRDGLAKQPAIAEEPRHADYAADNAPAVVEETQQQNYAATVAVTAITAETVAPAVAPEVTAVAETADQGPEQVAMAAATAAELTTPTNTLAAEKQQKRASSRLVFMWSRTIGLIALVGWLLFYVSRSAFTPGSAPTMTATNVSGWVTTTISTSTSTVAPIRNSPTPVPNSPTPIPNTPLPDSSISAPMIASSTPATLALAPVTLTPIPNTPTLTPTNTPEPPPTNTPLPTKTPAIVNTIVYYSSNLRNGPGETYPRVGRADYQQEIKIIGQNRTLEWYLLDNGGWIAARLVAPPPGKIPIVPDDATPISIGLERAGPTPGG